MLLTKMNVRKLDKNVYDAAQERIKYIFDEFDNILISFSGGKDSGICLNLFYDYAKKTNQTSKLSLYTMDYEAGYLMTYNYVQDCFDGYPEIEKKYILCLPISAQCSVSMYQNYWIPWDKDMKDLWVRPMPEKYCINEDNCPFPFVKGSYGGDTRKDFTKWFADTYGKTAVIVGIRADESLSRHAIITSQHRAKMYKDCRYSKQTGENCYNMYPIYDWTTEDVWVCNAKFGYTYNHLYDIYYQAGVTWNDMRTASPFHICARDSLRLYRIIEPDTWGKMVSRVNGCNFGSIYGHTSALGAKNIKKPDHFTWKEYANFLINTLPEDVKTRLLYHLARLEKSWAEEGYGRNPRVIATMEKEGIVLEHTGKTSDLCIKDDYYEIVKIKSGIPDETSITDFRHCPSWKNVCVAILKNDWSFTYLSFSRSKEELKKRDETLAKYKSFIKQCKQDEKLEKAQQKEIKEAN